tara:strand:+ start:610 stop:891 length:282 start_codon:yes stop_codon:yes gene_type:complete
MPRFHNINGQSVQFTAAEETARDEEEQVWADGANDRDAALVRKERDALLAACDWRASTDVTMSDDWTTYRQALRDVPAQAGFPTSVTWPSEPS